MIVSIASGKGGTGKTMVAVNLAVTWSRAGRQVRLLDCDVEEPNCHLFLSPRLSEREQVALPIPQVDDARCSGCGECGKICQFGAIACLGGTVITFPELCHGCGGCLLACPEGAISEARRELGVVEAGEAGMAFAHGRLRPGEAMSPPLINAVRRRAAADALNVIDSPPGTSCPVVSAVAGSDYVILVGEPTPFGLNDLELAAEMLRELGLPFGVVANKVSRRDGDTRLHWFCRSQNVPVLADIPDDRRVAEACSRGELVAGVVPGYLELFQRLAARLDEVLR